jgi:hypothetical protein
MQARVLSMSIFALVFLTAAAYPMERDGISFPDRIEVNGAALALNGLGTREATIFKVNVYVAGLYLENPGPDGEAIVRSEETKRLILHFVRKVSESDITSAWTEGFEKNAGGDLPVFKERIRILNSWMTGMADGEKMMFTYVPGGGLEVSVKGEVKGVIEGSDFASVFLSIWLGGSPPNRGLRDGLLGLN